MTDHASLAEALVAAQADMPAVERDGKGNFGSFTTLGHLLAKVRPVLNEHGIAVSQHPTHLDGRPALRTTLLHVSGEREEDTTPLILPKNDPQGQGSALTYTKRYALAAALAISDQEDDDADSATAAVQAQAPIPKDRVKKLVALWRKKELDHERLCLAFTAAGATEPSEDTSDARQAAFSGLTGPQADALEKVLNGE